jgi:hypothetical protein
VAQVAQAIRRCDPLYCRHQALLMPDQCGKSIDLVTGDDLLRALEAGHSEVSLVSCTRLPR